jgi:23S rRNA (guanine745-N1)-methyltransferase
VRIPLACTVRNCVLPLEKRDRAYVCESGHSYDIARTGYVNLLQPQDRRSREPGDAKMAVAARAALLTAGIGRTLVDAVASRVAQLDLPARAVVVDLGSGSGEALGSIAERRPVTTIGIDISVAACDFAARYHPGCTWVVANADRRLPLLDGSIDVVLSLYGRRNPAECARVLTSAGTAIVALPAPDDLIELREAVQGQAVQRDRADAVAAAHRPWFSVVERALVSETPTLEREALMHLLHGTYRGARLAWADRVARVDRMSVTLASEVIVMKKREGR